MQEAAEVLPVVGLYLPVLHLVQLDLPVVVWNLPAGQLSQLVAAAEEYLPTSQALQAVTLAPAAPAEPAAHFDLAAFSHLTPCLAQLTGQITLMCLYLPVVLHTAWLAKLPTVNAHLLNPPPINVVAESAEHAVAHDLHVTGHIFCR